MIENFIEFFLIVVFGAIFGSFISAATWRLPREENLVSESSKCRKCKAKLGFKDLIPIISWLLAKGKCRHCENKIGVRYILTEIATVKTFILNYLIFGLTPEFYIISISCIGILILIISDLETYIIPDTCHVILVISGIAHAYLLDKEISNLLYGIIAGLIISLGLRQVFMWVLKKDPLGIGDVKLFMVAGLWIGWTMMPFYMVLSGLLGVATGAVWQKIFKNPVFPFGPALAIALYIIIIFQREISSILLLK